MAALLLAPSLARAESRVLSMHNMNTGEDISVVYKKDGQFIPDSLGKLDWFLRDWRKDKSTKMDSRLFDVVWEVYRRSGATAPIQVHSGFRSKSTNARLRATTAGVAQHSQHINGKALDFHIPGVPVAKLRDIAMKMQDGGVGYYPHSKHPFVHVDVANVRHWPRMSRSQLVALFPSGLSAHIPSDGRPLSGFKAAIREIAENKAKPALGKAAQALAALVPSRVPLPQWRPEIEDVETASAGEGDPSFQNAFAATDTSPTAAFDRILSSDAGMARPLRTGPRKPPKPAAFASRFIDRGLGEKGPRVTLPEARKAAFAWRIGGYL